MLSLEVMEVLKSGHLVNGAGGSLKGVSCQREHLQTQLTICITLKLKVQAHFDNLEKC